MNRLLVALLSVFDAAIAAAVGVAIALAPMTLVFVFAFGGGADWSALWPAGATVWQLGHLVPQTLTLPGEYLAATGLGADAASFVLSLSPLALATFTGVFAARSGARAAHAGAGVTGVLASSLAFAAVSAAVALTSGSAVVSNALWQAVLFPALVFAVPAVLGALVVEWREAGDGAVARLRDRLESAGAGWGAVPDAAVRGAAVALTALVGMGALLLAVSLVVHGGQVVALYEAAHVDVLGATVLTLGQLAYLPTLVVWSLSFLAGPGFALGTGTSVTPAGTQLGVVPGIPVLGVLPSGASAWLLLLALLPVAAGALAGWVVRSRSLATEPVAADSELPATAAPWATAALEGLIGPPPVTDLLDDDDSRRFDEPFGPRAVTALAIALLTAVGAGLLCLLASGSLGPGRLAEVGPQPGAVALAVGVEVLVGAGILLLAPRRGDDRDLEPVEDETDAAPRPRAVVTVSAGASDTAPVAPPADPSPVAFAMDHAETAPIPPIAGAPRVTAADQAETAPIEPLAASSTDAATSPRSASADPDPDAPAPRRPRPLPPLD